MKTIFIFATILALALAAPQVADITKYQNDNTGLGSYSFEFETSDGVSRQETGQILNQGTEQESLSVQGSYQYTDLDGKTYSVQYIADENGFQPQGDHIPHV